MRQGKWRIVLILVVQMIVLIACSVQETQIKKDTKIKIVTTIFPSYDFVREITKERAEIVMLLKPGMESHSYEPTPQDIIAIKECDLFIYGGGESDEWVEDLLEGISKPETEAFRMQDTVSLLEEAQEQGQDSKEHIEQVQDEYDEHVWTSPQNAIQITKAMEEKICEIDSVNALYYKENGKGYIQKLEQLDIEFKEWRSKIERPILLFGDRFPFQYMAKEYDLQCYAAFPGCSSETEPSAKTMAFLVNMIRNEEVSTIFKVELSNEKVVKALSEATGTKWEVLHSCHNISKEELGQGVTYLSLMRENLAILKRSIK